MMSSGRASPSPCSTARRCSALSVASEGLVIGAGENESGHAPVSTAAPGPANVAEPAEAGGEAAPALPPPRRRPARRRKIGGGRGDGGGNAAPAIPRLRRRPAGRSGYWIPPLGRPYSQWIGVVEQSLRFATPSS